MNLNKLVIVISTFLVLQGCAQVGGHVDTGSQPDAPPVATGAMVSPTTPAEPEAEVIDDVWERIRSQLSLHTIKHPKISEARAHYRRQDNYIPVVSERASPYLHYIVEEVEKRGMPIEIALLPMVESTYSPFALSSQRAAGLWQIMPATGKQLGLAQNWWYDGRRDLRESTDAALNFLEELHRDLGGDWLVALAAYNSGKGRVSRAIRANKAKGLPTDYWSLDLPRETQRYVPRLIALSSLVAFPEIWEVEFTPIPNTPAFETVNTGGQIELAKAASLANLELAELRAYNPGQLRWATAPEQAPELLVPVGSGARLTDAIAQLTPEDRVQWQRYRIQRGDSLIRIARNFNTEVGLLQDVNHIKGSRIRAGDILMIPDNTEWRSSLAYSGGPGERKARPYRVQQGDSLYRIAGKFNVSIDEIIAWNSLNPESYLQPGQKLTLYLSDS